VYRSVVEAAVSVVEAAVGDVSEVAVRLLALAVAVAGFRDELVVPDDDDILYDVIDVE